LEKIYNDIVVNKRGGFCYENNGLFCWLLREIGFNVEILQGQAYVRAKKEFLPEFDHMCLMVIKKSMWFSMGSMGVGSGGSDPLNFHTWYKHSRERLKVLFFGVFCYF